MSSRPRQDDRLYWWKVAAGSVTTAYLAALLLTALRHESGSAAYAPVVAVVLVAVASGVAVSVVRRGRAWLRRPPRTGGPLEERVASIAGVVGTAIIAAVIALRIRRNDRS
ncbi:hypothetical protein ACQPZF_25375 [Actinosynnema sp. CS-041913]|uniref:hypothetical protein n=1 Tax=Actinosynnema sp. CS-041913 TaxID=3239917 RepID=UPI003D8E96CC